MENVLIFKTSDNLEVTLPVEVSNILGMVVPYLQGMQF